MEYNTQCVLQTYERKVDSTNCHKRKMAKREIPVYLFTGFLDAGKTTFIQETLEDSGFNDDKLKTLLVVCEEGEREYEPEKFEIKDTAILVIENSEELTPQRLSDAAEQSGAEKVIVEYNGMWMLEDFYNNLPENWIVFQEMFLADSQTIESYNKNMRQLVYNKLNTPELVVFKNVEKGSDYMPLHKLVRQANRRCRIIYEYDHDDVEFDNIEDPLPFDMEADVIEIDDNDYALWYADMSDNESKYYGKTVRYKARTLVGGGAYDNEFVAGRHIMTCCEDDIQFGGLVVTHKTKKKYKQGGWVILKAKVGNEYNHLYKGNGPVLHALEIEECEAPEREVATFY